jgi:hypothetical protein
VAIKLNSLKRSENNATMASSDQETSPQEPHSIQEFQQALAFERKRNLELQAQHSSQLQALTVELGARDRKINLLKSTVVELVKEAAPAKPVAVAQTVDAAGTNSEKKPPAKRKTRRPPKHKAGPTQEQALTKRQIQWNKRFAELVAFKEVHGHCSVSNGSGPYHALGLWVYSQRLKQKQLMDDGKECGLGLEQIRRLRSIGFIFQAPPTGQLPFDQRLQQLMEFKAKEGHCNVPQNCSGCPKGLPNFVQDQRKYYRQRQTGKKNSLTQERIDQLNALAFPWSLRDPSYQQKR